MPSLLGSLDLVPQAVVCGFEWGIAGQDVWDVARRLELVDQEQRGFAYAGAAMAFAIRDAVAGGGRRTRELLLGPGVRQIQLSHVGIGFAMARLPRRLWRDIIPDLTGSPMAWLAVDGYGFDLAYFHTRRYVDEQRVPAPYPWEGSTEYFPRAVDQGIGRALWFINGADPVVVTNAVDRFAQERRADLWSGIGLAATYAGGVPADGLAKLRDNAGEHWSQLGLGVVFAIKARADAGYVPEHSAVAAEKLAGLTVPDAVAIADRTQGDPARDTVPPYEQWRNRIRAHFMATALSSGSQNRRHRAWPTSAGSGTREVVNGSHGV